MKYTWGFKQIYIKYNSGFNSICINWDAGATLNDISQFFINRYDMTIQIVFPPEKLLNITTETKRSRQIRIKFRIGFWSSVVVFRKRRNKIHCFTQDLLSVTQLSVKSTNWVLSYQLMVRKTQKEGGWIVLIFYENLF